VFKGTAVLAGLAAVRATGQVSAAQAAPASTSRGTRKARVLLVRGAWAHGFSGNAVIAILQRHGHHARRALPLRSLAGDLA
jgi:hypothetical protein